MALDVDGLVGLRRVSAFDVHPDGTWLAVAAAEEDEETGKYRTSLWKVPADGGDAERLLDGPFDDSAPCFRQDGVLGFLSDRDPEGGDERPEPGTRKQVWLLDHDGVATVLTHEPLGVRAFRFAAAADRLVVCADVLPGVPHDQQREVADERKKKGPSALHYRQMPVRFWDHWLSEAAPHLVVYTGEGEDRTDLTPDADREYRETHFDLSADGSTLVATHIHVGHERLPAQALAVFDLDSGEVSFLEKAPDRMLASPCISEDGARIAASLGTWQPGAHGPSPLWVGSPDGATIELWHDGVDLWLQPVAWVGEDVLCAADVQGDRALFLVGPDRISRITGPGSYGPIAPQGGPFAVRHGTTHPPEVVRLDLDGEAISALSGVSRAELEADVVVEPGATSLPDEEGAEVPWWIIRPRDAEGALPTLLWIHGGPIGQWGDQWHWRWNPLVMAAAGWQVVVPNPRGSTGLGREWVEGIWGNVWGEACFTDLMAVSDDLAADARVDARRMVAMGGSFGGYMTNWIGTQTDRFAALVTHASVFSYGTFYGTTDLPAYWAWMLGEHPWGDRDAFERYSPDRHVADWKSPTLVIHGDKDYRVPISEGLFLFEALRRHGVDAELLAFPDENHWILKPNNIRAWYQAVIDFIDRHAETESA